MCLLGVCAYLAATFSCSPMRVQTAPECSLKSDSGGQSAMGKTPLSREQIIEIANAAARDYGWDPGSCTVVFDEGNSAWKSKLSDIQSALASIPLPERETVGLPPMPWLEGHDYQVVQYVRRAFGTGADLWVFVDRDTGEVLKVFAAG